VLKKNHADEQYLTRRSLRDLPADIDRLSRRLSELSAAQAKLSADADRPIAIGGRECSPGEATEVLGERLKALTRSVSESRRVRLGVYRGLNFGMVLHPQGAPEIFLEGATTRHATLFREHRGPRAVLNALERLAEGYGPEMARVRQDLAVAQAQLRDYEARLGQPFAHDTYLSELAARRDRLKAGLSGEAAEPWAEAVPVAELAEKIKTLKAAQTIEAAPERTGERRSTAEEPVTARIRRRAGESPVSGQVLEPDSALLPTSPIRPPDQPPGPESVAGERPTGAGSWQRTLIEAEKARADQGAGRV
jgi:hypothetical protein